MCVNTFEWKTFSRIDRAISGRQHHEIMRDSSSYPLWIHVAVAVIAPFVGVLPPWSHELPDGKRSIIRLALAVGWVASNPAPATNLPETAQRLGCAVFLFRSCARRWDLNSG